MFIVKHQNKNKCKSYLLTCLFSFFTFFRYASLTVEFPRKTDHALYKRLNIYIYIYIYIERERKMSAFFSSTHLPPVT